MWDSPDGKIRKKVVKSGEIGGLKPYQNSSCRILVSNCSVITENLCVNEENIVIVGENDSELGRLLDICLQTMVRGEVAEVTFRCELEVQFLLQLLDFDSKGFIHDWRAGEKYNLALHHKSKGNELFNDHFVDASHRFGKALKILCSIPIAVQDPPETVDGINVKDIGTLKATLYNNLASCYLKNGNSELTLALCRKVLDIDDKNVKALYKCGVAYINEHDYDKAREMLKKALDIDPGNKAAKERLLFANLKFQEATDKVNVIIKKMFEV